MITRRMVRNVAQVPKKQKKNKTTLTVINQRPYSSSIRPFVFAFIIKVEAKLRIHDIYMIYDKTTDQWICPVMLIVVYLL